MKLVFALLLVALLASCRCPRCWEKSEGHAFSLTQTSTQVAAELEVANRDYCSDLDPNAFDRSLWINQCKDTFANYVMRMHCSKTADRFCAERCPEDSTCAETGGPTLERVCAGASFEDFTRLVPYCKDFELVNTVPVPTGDDSGPRCE